MSQIANRIIKNTGFLYAKMGVTLFISLWTTRIILNTLGASDFGVYSLVGSAISMLAFLNGSMASTTQRFMSFAEGAGEIDKEKTIFNVSIVIHFCISIVVSLVLLVASIPLFNGILNIQGERLYAAKIVYLCLIVSMFLTIINSPYDAVLNAHENMRIYAIIGILESILKLMVAISCVYASTDKLIVYAILMAVIPLITLSLMKAYCHFHYEECIISIKKYWNTKTAKEMTSFAGWGLISHSVIMVSSYGQGIVLNHFFGTILNAAQGIAGQLNGQMSALSNSMMKAVSPVISKSAGSGDKSLLVDTSMESAKFSSALYLIISLPLCLYIEPVLIFWLKTVPPWTAIFIRLLLLRTLIEFLFVPQVKIIHAYGKIKSLNLYMSLFNIFQLPVIWLLFSVGLPPYYMYIVCIFFGNILVYAYATYFNFKYYDISTKGYINRVIIPITYPIFVCICVYLICNLFVTTMTFLIVVLLLIIQMVLFSISFYYFGCTIREKMKMRYIFSNTYYKTFCRK